MKRARLLIHSVCMLLVLALFAACAGVSSSLPITLSGTVISVNPTGHSVSLEGNGSGQTVIISELSDQQLTVVKPQQFYTFQVTQNGNRYISVSGTQPVAQAQQPQAPGTTPTATAQATSAATPTATATTQVTTQGYFEGQLSFTGKIESVDREDGTFTMSMPDNTRIKMRSDNPIIFFRLQSGQNATVQATSERDDTFTVHSIKLGDNVDQNGKNVVEFQAITTSTVGGDHVLHFQVGNKAFSARIDGNTKLRDFKNEGAISAGKSIRVEVRYSGSSGTALDINSNN